MKKVVIVGGGPAGMFAALAAAQNGHQVTLLEKNEKLGKKLYITGKGRCNVTNAGDMDTLFANVMSNRKFLYSAFYAYDNQKVMDFFEHWGVKLKIERGNRVFPVSDHSSDIIAGLTRALKAEGVRVKLHTSAERIMTQECDDDKQVTGVQLTTGEVISCDAVVIATGGISYQSTGSTGDGYRFAEETGHKLVKCSPSLVPLTTKEDYVFRMQGLALKNVNVTIKKGKKVLFSDFGEMLFTHCGVSGPLILSASSVVGKYLKEQELPLEINLKPAVTEEQLRNRMLKDFDENKNRQFKNVLHGFLPSKMMPVMMELSGIDPEKQVNSITREERERLVQLFFHFPMTLTGLGEFKEAIITKGGVSVKDINPSTMESKKVKGMYYAGEVLDLDALTGGFNLQIAWSTGYLAGNSIEPI